MIASAVAALPAEVGVDVVDAAEARLITDAADFEPAALRRLGGHVLIRVAPQVAEQVEAEALRREEEKARLRRGCSPGRSAVPLVLRDGGCAFPSL